MSQPVSRFLHPFGIARHPSLEPEVERAILARWATDRSSGVVRTMGRKPFGNQSRARAKQAANE